VATNPPDGRTEETWLERFKNEDRSLELVERGGGFGVQCLLQQLIKLQGVMVQRLDMPLLIRMVGLHSTYDLHKAGVTTACSTWPARQDVAVHLRVSCLEGLGI
jgi:hypothetical protein